MLVHAVYFWLKPDLTDDDRTVFADTLRTLERIDSADWVYIGPPAATPERPVVDASYDWALVTVFPDIAAHDVYQAHELHQAFLERCKPMWERVQIYDSAG